MCPFDAEPLAEAAPSPNVQAHKHASMKDRPALIISLVAMTLIWLFVTGLLKDALHTWKRDWQHTFVHVLAVVTLIAFWLLIPFQIVQSLRNKEGTGR